MGAVMAWYLLKYGCLRLWLAIEPASAEARRSQVNRLRGRVIREAMARLGACFVKLGQVMSTRPDLLPSEWIEELRQLQDKLPPFPGSEARRIIEEDLGKPVSAAFSEFDDTPVAAASVAQVHRARLADGSEVAVKVLRPDVREKVHRDATILRTLSKVLAWSPTLRLSDPVGHTEEFTKGIEEQTDLRRELANYQRFAANFEGFPGVRFPRVLAHLSGERVMTMEFMRGAKLDALPAGDHRLLARKLQETIFKMCFEDGFVHADLHPGNMVLHDTSGDLVIFDVGLVKELSGEVFEQFFDFTRCLAGGTPDDFLRHMKRFHRYLPGDVDWSAMERDIVAFLKKFRGRSVAELEMGAFFNELYALARDHHVRPIPDAVLVMVGVVTAEGIGKQLDPSSNVFENVTTFMMPVLVKRGMAPGLAMPAAPTASA
jgi:ubiquinone biosynthesis protein